MKVGIKETIIERRKEGRKEGREEGRVETGRNHEGGLLPVVHRIQVKALVKREGRKGC